MKAPSMPQQQLLPSKKVANAPARAVTRSVADSLSKGGRSLPAVPFLQKKEVIQYFTFRDEETAILYFEDDLLDNLDENLGKVMELQNYAHTKKWEDLEERIDHYLQGSKIYMELILSKLNTKDPANLPRLMEMLQTAQEYGRDDIEEMLLPLVRKLEDRRDEKITGTVINDDLPFGRPEPEDSKEHEKRLRENKTMDTPAVFLNFVESKGKDRKAAGEYIPLVLAAHNPQDARNFVAAQKAYQALLKTTLGLSNPAITDYHQSAGYEFEFASFKYKNGKVDDEIELMPSHIDLAHSEVFSTIFGLPFKLETDSSNALEVATPPFLFLISGGARNILSKVFALYTDASAGLEKALSMPEESLLQTKAAEMTAFGFGANWVFTSQANNLTALPNRKHKKGPYGQANISMTAGEIVEFLLKLSQEERSSSSMSWTSDKTETTHVLNECFSLLKSRYKPSGVPDPHMAGALLLYSRSATNLIAIPSILLRQQYSDYAKKPEPNYATEVKESLGLWVKDNPHRVLLQYMKNLEYGARDFRDIIAGSGGKILGIILERLGVHDKEVINWIRAMKTSQSKAAIEQERLAIVNIKEQSEKIRRARLIPQKMKEAEIRVEEATRSAFERYSTIYLDSVKKELLAFNKIIIHMEEPVVPQRFMGKTSFLNEKFTTGLGVRKDTYLGSMEGENRTVRVGEIRGEKELHLYEKESK